MLHIINNREERCSDIQEKDVISNLIVLLEKNIDVIELANNIFYRQKEFSGFNYSTEFREVLLDIITQEEGEEFKIPVSNLIAKLQAVLNK